MPVVDAQVLHKAYGPHAVLDGVSLTIRSGERVGLVGVNGSGKSTLARILAGLEAPDSGTVAVRRGARVVYLAQCPTLEPNRTAREEVLAGLSEWKDAEDRYLSASAALAASDDAPEALLRAQAQAAADVERLGGWEVAHRAEAILGHLGLSRLDARMSTMSGGEQRRVGLARVLVAAPDLALLDEPTNHLDVETVEWLERHLLEEYRGALLLITHDRYVLDRVVSRILELDQSTLVSYQGGYEDYLDAKAHRLALEARIEANRQNFLRQELEWLRRQPKARTTKQKARVQRAEEVLASHGPARAEEVRLSIEVARSGKTVLELHDLHIDVEGRELVRGLDLSLVKGQRLGVIGRSGCGKTTLLRTLVGELEPASGRVVAGKHTRLSYLGQLRDDLDPSKTILDNVTDGGSHVVVGDRAFEVRAYLDRFLFPPEKLRQPVGSLSGGERTRVALAKLLHQTTNLILLDEPANDLDLPTISALEQMLVEFEGTAIVVTHDRWFLDRVATGLLVFEGEGTVVHYAGNYTTYRALRAEREAAGGGPVAGAAAGHRSAPHAERRRPSKPASLTYAERLELQSIVGEIESAEARVAELERRLAAPETYHAGGQGVASLIQELKLAREEAARLLTRWEALETKQLGAP
jgi:ATP-binding cassette subfamily F protein uup